MSRTEKSIPVAASRDTLPGAPCHECAPREWRRTRDLTGSFELDAVIERSTNTDVPHRLAYYLEKPNAYGARTGYDGYHGYHGDD